MRPYRYSRDVTAGCFNCYGSDARWRGGNAQGVAARHHDATGHETWCDIYLSVVYGEEKPEEKKPEKKNARRGR